MDLKPQNSNISSAMMTYSESVILRIYQHLWHVNNQAILDIWHDNPIAASLRDFFLMTISIQKLGDPSKLWRTRS